ncbi:MAG: bacteriocin [Eubacteriales bacterium]|nr:bacteriocin [Eubacteriales bacterium]
MKTKEELNTLKEEYKSLQKKLSELTDDELSLVTGGFAEERNAEDKQEQEKANVSRLVYDPDSDDE